MLNIRQSIWPFVVSVVFQVAGVTAAAAADVSTLSADFTSGNYGDNCLVAHLKLSGEIVDGDADRLSAEISKADRLAKSKNSSCYVNDAAADRLIYVELDSPGGKYLEGWKIAKLLNSYDFQSATYVGKGDSCFSACAIGFLGGSVPGADGATLMRRIIDPSAQLGFHAPFPVLEDRQYDAKTVREFFLTAFTISSEFMKDAKGLGISYEVAQLLLQPTPDSLYMIDTSGRAILTNVAVSAAPFEFSTYSSDLTKDQINAKSMANLCYNNQILKDSGDQLPMLQFLKYRIDAKAPLFREVRSKTGYFSADKVASDVVVVPTADAGEGDVQSCVSEFVSAGKSDGSVKLACLGFAFGEQELAAKILKVGVDQMQFGEHDRCSTSSKLALLPFNTKLVDIPDIYLGN